MNKKNFLLAGFLLATSLTFAGTEGGGGGDASEVRVNEIRSDILKWIINGGAKDLNLSKGMSYGQYVDSMTGILQPKKVIIEFTEKKVLVRNVEKTCRGYFMTNAQAHIQCNIPRFKGTTDSEQYKLIHHEYAGLVNVEKNEGASSDYELSEQLNEYLVDQIVKKLAVKTKKIVVSPFEKRNEVISVGAFISAEAQFENYAKILELAKRKIYDVKILSINGYNHILEMSFSHRAMKKITCNPSSVDVPSSKIKNLESEVLGRLNLLRISPEQLVDAEIRERAANGKILTIRLFYCQ